MNIEDIPLDLRNEYKKTCPLCTMTMIILSKADNWPEYYAEIYVQCQCGEYLNFELPVN